MCVPGPIYGVSVCTMSPGIMQSCQDIVFTKVSRERMLGTLVLFFFLQHVLYFSPLVCRCFSVRQCFLYLPALYSSGIEIVLQQLYLWSQWGLFHFDWQNWHVIHSSITEAWLPNNSLCSFNLLKVEVDSDCIKVALGQRVTVTIKTVPRYCGIAWQGTYEAPGTNLGKLFPVYLVTGNKNLSFFYSNGVTLLLGCVTDDVKKHIPECISKFFPFFLSNLKRVTVFSGTFCKLATWWLRAPGRLQGPWVHIRPQECFCCF